MDRVSGTGAGKKDQRKGGNRAGGANVPEGHLPAEVFEKDEESKEVKEVAEGEGEEKKGEEPDQTEEAKEQKAEEEDEEALPGIDFRDYEASQALKKESGVLKVA